MIAAHKIFDELEDGYYEVDLRGSALYYNAALARMLGYSLDELVALSLRRRLSRKTRAHIHSILSEVHRTSKSVSGQAWDFLHKDGRVVVVECSVHLMRTPANEPFGFRGIVRDITEVRRQLITTRENEERFRALSSISSDHYWEQDAQHKLVRSENRDSTPYKAQSAYVGMPVWETDLIRVDDPDWHLHRALLDSHQPFRDILFKGTQPNGRDYFLSVSGAPIFDAEEVFRGYRGMTRDITAQKYAESKVQHIAMHDGLTGLPNRRMFGLMLTNAIASAARYQRPFAILFVDLDRFKFINDSLGHEAGDMLLKVITERFKATLRASDTIARLGGDEFVVLAQDAADADQVRVVARKLLDAAQEPVELAGQQCRISASVGIALYPSDGLDEQTLMKNADIAMYVAKDEGKNTFQLFSPDINSRSIERLSIESNLRLALERREFSLQYQAKVAFHDNSITGVEALLRWNHPQLGAVSPTRFIPIAEETGSIVAIGKWVLLTACAQAVAWDREGLPPIGLAVNVSARQFADEHFVDDVRLVLEQTGLEPQRLELEITEGMLIHNSEQTIRRLAAIKKMGVRLAIDDFGTGYSSLGQLQNFPIDTLKVDRSFVRDLEGSERNKAITAAIIAMGKTLSLKVVAEGVETLEQQTFLHRQDCDEMQGYRFSRPIGPAELAALVRSHGMRNPQAPLN